MKGILGFFAAAFVAAAGFLAVGCATDAARVAVGDGEPRFPFPQRAFDRLAVVPMLPTVRTQEEMDGMILGLFREMLRNDLIVDSNGPQTRESFRMVFRHFQQGEIDFGILDVSHIATSESQGYGMVILAYMAGSEEKLGLAPYEWIFGVSNLRDYFDAMLRTVLEFQSTASGLFTLRLLGYQDAGLDGVTRGGYRIAGGVKTAPFTRDADFGNATTSGNMDIIYALILADRQWGSSGRYDYIGIARAMLAELWAHCVHAQYRFMLLGDWVNALGSPIHRNTTRTSDFMISHLKAFRDADPAHDWQSVIDASYNVIMEIREAQNAIGNRNGFLPDFAVLGANGWDVPPGNIVETFDYAFAYNAVRVPWRLGTGYILFGNAPIGASTLYDYVIRPLDDFARAFTEGDLVRLGPMYMDGTPFEWVNPNWFAPPFAVTAAAVGADQAWVNSFWDHAPRHAWDFHGLGVYQGGTYMDYIRLLVLLTITGNFWMP